ncbi:MAG: hypothetical protein Q7R49_03815 [Candidatus Daviesbacteria bacterium]|nr:hypothetical protein [Candidatus Daviesbacteria bacterium]
MDSTDIKEFYQKNRIIIFPVLVALSSLILIILVIYPQISILTSNNASLNETVKKSAFLEVKAAELQSLDETQLQHDVKVTLNALPSDRDYLDTMTIIQNLLGESGFTLQSLQFIPGDSTTNSRPSFTIRLEISGSRVSLNQFLTNVESTYRPMRVASLETSSQKQDSNLVSAVVAVNAFYAPLPSTLGSIDAPLPTLSDQDQQLVATLAKFVPQTNTIATSVSSPRGKSDPFN